MERLRGRVAALEHEHRVVGRARGGRPPSAVHVYRFDVAGHPVELRHGAALPVNEGDEVVVVTAGRRSPRRVYAWHNRTWGATLVEPRGATAAMRGWLPAVPAIALFAGAAGLADAAGPLAGMLGLAGLALALVSARGFVEYARYRRAAAHLDMASGR